MVLALLPVADAWLPMVNAWGVRSLSSLSLLKSTPSDEAVVPEAVQAEVVDEHADVPYVDLEKASPENVLRHMVQFGVDYDEETIGDLLPNIDIEEELEEESQTPQFGDMNGLDAPRDAPWRLKAEDIIRDAVVGAGLHGVELYDITWNIADLQVMTQRAGLGGFVVPTWQLLQDGVSFFFT